MAEAEDCWGVTVIVGATAIRKTWPTPTSAEEPPGRVEEEEEEEDGRGEGAAG